MKFATKTAMKKLEQIITSRTVDIVVQTVNCPWLKNSECQNRHNNFRKSSADRFSISKVKLFYLHTTLHSRGGFRRKKKNKRFPRLYLYFVPLLVFVV